MKYTTIFTPLIIFLLSGFEVKAQFDVLGDYNKLVLDNWTGEYVETGGFKVKGSLYLYGKSVPGEIKIEGGSDINNANLFYDLYNQEVGLVVDNKFVGVDSKIESFKLGIPDAFGKGELLFKPTANFTSPKRIKGYFNVVAENTGKYAFLRRFVANIAPDPHNQMASELRIFQQNIEYYIYNFKDKSLRKVQLRAKDITKAIPEAASLANLKSFDLTTSAGVANLIQSL